MRLSTLYSTLPLKQVDLVKIMMVGRTSPSSESPVAEDLTYPGRSMCWRCVKILCLARQPAASFRTAYGRLRRYPQRSFAFSLRQDFAMRQAIITIFIVNPYGTLKYQMPVLRLCAPNYRKQNGVSMKMSFRWYGESDPISLGTSHRSGIHSIVSAVYFDVKPARNNDPRRAWPDMRPVRGGPRRAVFDVVSASPCGTSNSARNNVDELLDVYCEAVRRAAPKYGVSASV